MSEPLTGKTIVLNWMKSKLSPLNIEYYKLLAPQYMFEAYKWQIISEIISQLASYVFWGYMTWKFGTNF